MRIKGKFEFILYFFQIFVLSGDVILNVIKNKCKRWIIYNFFFQKLWFKLLFFLFVVSEKKFVIMY